MGKSIQAQRTHGDVRFVYANELRAERLGALRAIPVKRRDTLMQRILRALGVR